MTRDRRALLKGLAEARRRAPFLMLGGLPADLVHDLLDFYRARADENILSEAICNRKARDLEVDDTAYLQETYAQVALQVNNSAGDTDDRRNYTRPVDASLVDRVATLTGPFYRARLSSLQPGAELPWHVDDPGQLRAVCLLEGRQTFQLKVTSEIIGLNMSIGDVWFVNTAFEHRVLNPGEISRIALLLNLFEGPDA